MAATEGVSPVKPPIASSSSSSSASTSASFAGRIIKQFRLVEEIGEGPNGRVFVAEDTNVRRHVALKLIPAKYRDGRPNDRAQRLIDDARRSAAALDHPHVVPVREIDSAGAIHYIAMELLEGGNLERQVQQGGPMDIGNACQLVAEAATALAHAHQRGIVHRDVKPSNLLVTRSGRCRVGDFGFAMVEMPAPGMGVADDAAGKIRCVGMPHFVAPELAAGKVATPASDIYSLGCTLFFLLTGRPPFPAANARQALKMHVSDPLPDVRQWRGDAPARLVEAIVQACAKDPKQRYPSAEQFAAVLRTFTIATPAASASASASSSSPGRSASHFQDHDDALGGTPFEGVAPPPPPLPSFDTASKALGTRGWIAWSGAAVVAIGLLAVAGIWLTRPSPKPDQTSLAPRSPAAAPVPAPAPAAVAPTPAAPEAVTAADVSSSAPAGVVEGASDDMEELDPKVGVPLGWNVQARYKPQVALLEEGGNHFVRLTNPDASKIVYFDRKIKLDPSWVAVTVSARMRSTNFKAGSGSMQDGRVAILFKDEGGKRIGNYPTVPSVRGDTTWTVRSATADVPPGAKSLQLQAGIFNATGTVDFDDIIVTPQK